MNLAAENFLIPNGTFFACLLIFVIVLIVIRTMVVPPIVKVLDERNARVAQTAEDNRAAAASYEDADTEYRAAMKDARGDATGIRDEARAKANEELAAAKRRATDEADSALAENSKALKVEADSALETARRDVDRLAQTLAGRVLGNDVKAAKAEQTETVN
ncbi:F0F1 ATP synthase subunit B [Gordonia sp. CPCC 206044]|uniref:F0F1 ATP synthase subunit B n=1 Tax=Gordonia sp. CPCC 206044 TaxID=3140793 RepID=UPI003AF351CC